MGEPASSGPPPDVRRWLKIALVLNCIMGAIFVAACIHNYYSSNQFIGDEGLVVFLLLAPLLIWGTYGATKDHVENSVDRLKGWDVFGSYNDFDSFAIPVIKLFLVTVFVHVVIEIAGYQTWHSFLAWLVTLSQRTFGWP